MDAASGIAIPAAFGAGLISFLSPCVLPLVPGYISAVAGVQPGQIRARRVIGPSLAFVASFSFIFIVLGLLGQRALHATLTGPTALKVSGAVIIAMGVIFVLAPFVPLFSRELHVDKLMQRAGRGGPVLDGCRVRARMDAVHGADARRDHHRRPAPRARPRTARSCSPSTASGSACRSWSPGSRSAKRRRVFGVIKRHYPIVIGVGGAILIGMGILIITGEFTTLNITVDNWLNSLGLPEPELRHLGCNPEHMGRA